MKVPVWLKVILWLLVYTAATVAAIYLAGAFFLILSKTNPMKATFSTFYQYWFYYHTDVIYQKRLNVSAIVAAVLAYGAPVVLYVLATQHQRALHGDARFARPDEIAKSGLLGSAGIIIGKFNNRFLMFGGQQFVLVAAPTRSGKGVGIIIPNLLNFADSAVVLDIKQENYNLTAGFRAKHSQKVFLFNPFAEDFRTSRYNALDYVRDGDFRVGDLIAIGEVFFPSGGRDSFFDDQARNLFVGLGLYLCETPDLPRTLGEMLRQSSGKGKPVKDYLLGIIKQRNHEVDEDGDVIGNKVWDGEGPKPLSSECIDSLNRFTSTSDNTLSSILASFNAPLGIWANPIVDAATAVNDFDLREVRKQRMTIYVGITPDHLAEAGRLVNLLFSQLINLNTKELPQDNPALKYQCLLLMDEFTSIGRVGIIAKSVSYMAGYNMRLLTIIQTPSQVEDDAPQGYGRQGSRTLITNHACQVLYAPRDQKDANEYSEMLGFETVKAKGTSRQAGRSGEGQSFSDQRRALLLPQEIKEIGLWKEIIVLENMKPILCEKIKYFEDPVFKARLFPAPAVPVLDMDTHRARLQASIRPLTVDDVAKGIDLSKLAIDTSKLQVLAGDSLATSDLVSFVDDFFSVIDAGGELGNDADEVDDEGSSEPPSADELAALASSADELFDPSSLEDETDSIDSPGINHVEGNFDEDQEPDFAMLDEPDFDFDVEAPDDLPEPPEPDEGVMLDLSVLDKPLRAVKNPT